METPVEDTLFRMNNNQRELDLLPSESFNIQEKNTEASITAKNIDSLTEGIGGILNQLKAEQISSKLETVISGEKVISGDILKLNDSLDKINSGIKKLQSSVSRLAEKTSKRMKIMKTIQIVTLLLLLLYIAYKLYQKLQF
jgi:methyl-accepting chemotaxis protein